MIIIPINEYHLSIDEFKEPKVSTNAEAVATLLVRLLLLEPGTFQSHPDMGVGIVSRYRYNMEGKAADLEADFKRQIETYLPNFQNVRVKVTEVLPDTSYLPSLAVNPSGGVISKASEIEVTLSSFMFSRMLTVTSQVLPL